MSKSIYPSIPSPGGTLASMTPCVIALRKAVTMIILNAQEPNANYSASSASQVFLTREDIKGLGIVGPPGPAGATGPAGASGVPEAPNDANTYGRHILGWTRVLTADASAQFLTLPTNAVNDAAAATAGVAVGGVYRNGSTLCVRVT